MLDMPIVVTLIHGTWAQNAPWTQSGSPLREALRSKLGETTFRAFQWSGENSFAARSAAAEGLKDFLFEGIEQSPEDKQAIIAHSHGGNVALEALNNFEAAERVDAVVCLATPFITTRQRQFGPHSQIAVGLAKAMGCVLFGFVVAWATTSALGAGDEGFWGPIALILMGIAGFGAWWTVSRLGKVWVEHAYAWSARIGVSAPTPRTQLLVIRSASDEPTEGLTAFHLSLTLVMAGWRLLSKLAIVPLALAAEIDGWAHGRLYGRVLIAAALWLACAAWFHWGYPDAPVDRKTFLLVYLAVILLAGAVFSKKVGLLELVAFLAGAVLRAARPAFVLLLFALAAVVVPFNTSIKGLWTFTKTAIWLGPVDVSAEAAPPGGASTIRQMSADASEGLRHSMPYLNASAIQWTVEWLEPLAEGPVSVSS